MFKKEKYLSLWKKDFFEALIYLSQEIPSSLFKFYSLGNSLDKAKLDTLSENKIWVELFKNQNDPFEMINLDIDESTAEPKYSEDGILLVSKENMTAICQRHMNCYKEAIKTASFCDTMATNISMWAYYSNNHQGFCCEYEPINRDLDSMKPLRPVLYEKGVSQTKASFVERLIASGLNALVDDSRSAQFQQIYNLEMIKLLASCKDESWAHEREYRAFYFGKRNGAGEAVKCSDINLKLKAIYAGIKCNEENKNKLRKIAEELGADFHEMRTSLTDYLLVG